MKFTVVFICLSSIVQYSVAVIYHLNEKDYTRMPPLFHLDSYESCLSDDDGKYCSVTVQLVPDAPSDLYNTIIEYSERKLSHFNHTILKYGICATKTCAEYMEQAPQDSRWALEACLNKSMYRDYGLKTRVIDTITCHTKDEKVVIDTADLVVAIILGIILMMNIVGSFYEIFWMTDSKQGIHILRIFSIRHNWRRLVATPGGPDPRINRLRGINGIKVMNMFAVVGLHSMMPFVVNIENTRFIEEIYSDYLYAIITNGTPIVQTFFVLGGFLLSYNFMIFGETHQIRWPMIGKGIFNRWFRLTAVYSVILAITATWLRHAGSGPLWDAVVVEESADCQVYWWYNLLYIQNYIDFTKCMPQMWYVACDFQLHVIGLLTLVLLSPSWRRSMLGMLLAGGMLANCAHTYWQDLDAVLVPSPEGSRNFYFTDPTFIHTYKRTHTNVSSYAIGLGLGLLVYHWQQTKYDINRILKNRYVYWLSVPALFAVLAMGEVFYIDTVRAPAYVRAIYSAFAKPVFSSVVAFIIVGMIYKYEDIYRGILEWPGWSVPGRLVYSWYAVHVLVIRYLAGTQTTLQHASALNATIEIITANILSLFLAIFLNLLVESPFNQLMKFPSSRPREEHLKTDSKNDKDNVKKQERHDNEEESNKSSL